MGPLCSPGLGHNGVMWVFVAGVLGTAGAVAAVLLGHRTLAQSTRSSAVVADAMSGLVDVFEPARARATRDLEAFERAGPVTPVPEDVGDAAVRIVHHPDGSPRAVRVRSRFLTPPE